MPNPQQSNHYQPGPQQPGQYPPGGPQQSAPKKKFGCLKWGLIVVAGLFVLWIIGTAIGGNGDKKSDKATPSTSSSQSSAQQATTGPSAKQVTTQPLPADQAESQQSAPASEVPQAPAPAPASGASREQAAALASAKRYLQYTAFSRDGLIKQLEFEKHPTEAATYAADNVGANWNDQAEKKAKQYQEMMPQSRDALINQLQFEGFTPDEAEYGASKVF